MAKTKRGRPRAPADAKIAARHSVNYVKEDNEIVKAAAAHEGERSIGRWVGRAALLRARAVLAEKEKP
jgi:hypothetical protein